MNKFSDKHLLNSTKDRFLLESIRLGRIFLLIGGAGLLFASILMRLMKPEMVPDMGVRYVVCTVCFIVLGLSYLSQFSHAQKSILIKAGVSLFVLYDCIITYVLHFQYLSLIGLMTIVACGTFVIGHGKYLNWFTGGTLVLIGFLLSILEVQNEDFRIYYFFTFFCLTIFCYLMANSREKFNQELLKNEYEAKLNKQILSSVIESSSDMIWSMDMNNTLLTFNQAFELFYHAVWNEIPVKGQLFSKDTFPFPIAGNLNFGWQEVWQGQHQVQDVQLAITSKTPIWMQLTLNPVKSGKEIEGYSGFAKNISDIKRKSSKLNFLKKAIENSGEALAVIRQDGHFEFVNQAFIRLTNISPGESSQQLANIVVEKNALRDGLALGLHLRSWTGTLTVTQPGGKKILVRAHLDGIADEKDESVGATLALVDITEITETQALLEGVLNSGLDGIMVFRAVRDNHHTIVDFQWIMANPAANSMVGRKSPVGKYLLNEMPGNKETGLFDRYVDVVETGQPISFEQNYSHEFIHNAWFKINAVKLGDGFAVTFSDITGQKKREVELQKLSLVASKSNSGVLIADNQGIIEWVNEAYSRITGYSYHELIGTRPGSSILGKNDTQKLSGITVALDEVFRTNKPFSGEVMNDRPDGKTYWLALNINPIFNDHGEVTEYIAIGSDITLTKQAEKQMRIAKEAAEDADKAKSDFLATMSHEIRTPMNAVIGLTSLLLETTLDYEQREYIETIRMSGDNLLSLINEILDFSKIESGNLVLENQPFSLVDLIEETFDLLAPKAIFSGLELIQDVDNALPALILSDPNRLRQVLVNLVGNAIKFTRQGEVAVFVRKNWITEEQVLLQFEIKDTGIGISDQKKHLLFKPFSQIDASITRKYGGTGLGLAISKRLINLMNGEIWVDSEENRGTSFFFTIQAGVVSHQLKPIAFPAKNVLILTDNSTQNQVLSQQLIAWGLNTWGATNVRSFREKLTSWPVFDLVLADFGIKGFNGESLTKELQAQFGDRIPIIFIDPAGSRKRKGLIDARSTWISKPIRRKSLLEALLRFFPPDQEAVNAPDITVSEAGENMPPLRVLIVEDNPINQKVATRLLQRLGYRVEVVSNGLEALMNVASRPYDLIFMDVQMPEMDGLTATRRLREVHGNEKPIIIAMTANALEGDREICIGAGMNDYIAKPVKLENVRDAILRWFQPTMIEA